MALSNRTFVVALALALFGVAVQAANPCGFRENGKQAFRCPGKEVCLATGARPRQALCSILRNSPGPICPKLHAPVCCRKVVGRLGSITINRSNPCLCKKIGGKVLFNKKCNQPPRKLVPCPLILKPVCCYIRKFDLTVGAPNSCVCSNAYSGILVNKRLCGIKTVEA